MENAKFHLTVQFCEQIDQKPRRRQLLPQVRKHRGKPAERAGIVRACSFIRQLFGPHSNTSSQRRLDRAKSDRGQEQASCHFVDKVCFYSQFKNERQYNLGERATARPIWLLFLPNQRKNTVSVL